MSPWRGRKAIWELGREKKITPVSYGRGRLAARFSVVRRAYRDAAQGTERKRRWRSGWMIESEGGESGETSADGEWSRLLRKKNVQMERQSSIKLLICGLGYVCHSAATREKSVLMSGGAGWWRSSATINKTKQKSERQKRRNQPKTERKKKLGEAIIIIIIQNKNPIGYKYNIFLLILFRGSGRWRHPGVTGWVQRVRRRGAGGTHRERDVFSCSFSRWRCCSLAFRASLLWLAARGSAGERLTSQGLAVPSGAARELGIPRDGCKKVRLGSVF